MTRLPDWERRLGLLLDQHRNTPFKWGVHDCHTWGIAAVEAVTGVALSSVRPYNDVRSAVRALKAFAPGYREAVALAIGRAPDKGWPAAGDVVIANRGLGKMPAVGVQLGELVAFAGPQGLVFERVPREKLEFWHL